MSYFKCSMNKKKESLTKKNERLFTLYDIHGKYPNFWKQAPWRTSQFWKDYEDYYSKAYPTMGIKITMKDNDSVDVTSNGKFIMNYSWKNGRHRATAEDGSGFKHPGFGFRDDLSMIYRGATGKEMGPYNAVYVDESKKKEAKKHTCSMQKKKESLAKKVESALDIIRVSDEDVVLVPEQVIVEHTGGRSFSVEIPTKDNRYYLSEMKEILKGMCEDSSGYLTAYQDGSVIVIIVNVPAEDENGEWSGEYNEDYYARCRVELVGSSCDSIADYLREE